MKLAEVSSEHAFTLAPAGWSQPLPDGVVWRPVIGAPLTRLTWAAWPAASRRLDLAFPVSAFETAAGRHEPPSS